MLFNLVDNGLILEDGPVVCEVDFLGLLREQRYATAGIFITFLEGLKGCNGLAAEAEGIGDFGPVELKGCAALKEKGYQQ